MSEALPIDRFAAALAHQLNAQMYPIVQFNPGALTVWLLDALAGRYADTLLGHYLFHDRMSKDEAALRYVEAVLERALILVRNESHTVAHELLISLCRRMPSPGWNQVALQRSRDAQSQVLLFGEGRSVAERLAELPRTVTKGSAAASRRNADGPLFLSAPAWALELPDELSVWGAIWAGPRQMKRLETRCDFNEFCETMIRALRSTHRAYQALCGLGHRICPFDWLGVMSTSQVRAVAGLQKATQMAHAEVSNAFHSRSILERIWPRSPVPGFASAQEFLESDFGRTLQGATPIQRVSFSAESGPEAFDRQLAREGHHIEDREVVFLREADFDERLSELVDRGILSADEKQFALAVYRGEELKITDKDYRKMVTSITRKLESVQEQERAS